MAGAARLRIGVGDQVQNLTKMGATILTGPPDRSKSRFFQRHSTAQLTDSVTEREPQTRIMAWRIGLIKACRTERDGCQFSALHGGRL